MVYIEKDNKEIPINGLITFREFMKNGFMGYFATIDDYILHQSLCFPDVRLKQYIEIRNHDTNNPKYALMICALYKGLASANMENLLKKFSYLKLENVESYYKNASKFGLDFKIDKNRTGWDVIAELFNISRKKLSAKERCYLEPMLDILKYKKTPADLIIDEGIETAEALIKFMY